MRLASNVWRYLLLIVVALACASVHASGRASAPATAHDGYGHVSPSPDGIGRTYAGREIAGVMGWQGAAWLERQEREREERGSRLLRVLALKPGMNVADIGAGTGYYERRIAPLVGPMGKVYAVDVQPQMVAMLKKIAARPEFVNVVPVLGAERDPHLAPGSIDLAMMVDVYHELAYPSQMLDAIVRALKPGGRVAFVEYRAEDPRVPIKSLHKMSEAQVRREAALHALTWQRTDESLPWQHVVIFVKR
ncbi:MAG: methyltransferase domain-containing protein [Luteimonas sp.]